MTVALVTGITGQDGSYLADLLLAHGYEVHGVVRDRGEHVTAGVTAHCVNFEDGRGIAELIERIAPDEIYNLAAVSSVFMSWEQPVLTAKINGLAVAEMLAAVHSLLNRGHTARFVQASSAEIFGTPQESPQNEGTAIRPTNPYGASKAYAHALVGAYRAAGVFASSVILYNHESPRRPDTFVTRKITKAAVRISRGLQNRLELGNLAARRDWGWAPDYVDALHRAAIADNPDDFIIATGVAHSVEDFVRVAFACVGVDDWRERLDVAPALFRSGDAAEQVGDARKAQQILRWEPTADFEEIVSAMVLSDQAAIDAPSGSKR
jgi:GDPmannose 4,6-dehydratase